MKKLVIILFLFFLCLPRGSGQIISIFDFEIDMRLIEEIIEHSMDYERKYGPPPSVKRISPGLTCNKPMIFNDQNGILVVQQYRKNSTDEPYPDLRQYSQGAVLGAMAFGTIGSFVAYYAEDLRLNPLPTLSPEIGERRISAMIGGAVLGTFGTLIGATIQKNIAVKREQKRSHSLIKELAPF